MNVPQLALLCALAQTACAISHRGFPRIDGPSPTDTNEESVEDGSVADSTDSADDTDADDASETGDAMEDAARDTPDASDTVEVADAADAADVADPADTRDVVITPDVVDIVDAADVVDVRDVSDVPDAGGPNLTIRFTLRPDPPLLFTETAPASMTRVNLTNAMCLGGLRVVSGGVECTYTMPLARGTEVRFAFSNVASYPTMESQWTCNATDVTACMTSSYVVTFNGMTVPSARIVLQALLDGRGTLTRFLDVYLP